MGTALGAIDQEGGSDTTVIAPMVKPGEPFQELSGVEFWKLEEQLFLYAKKLALQKPQEAVLHVRGEDPEFFRVSNVPDPKRTKAQMRDMDRQLLEGAEALPEGERWAAPVAFIEEETRARDAEFRKLVRPRPKPRAKVTAARAGSKIEADRKKRREP
jgi:hypothetical protein